jgi:hypothetical protein
MEWNGLENCGRCDGLTFGGCRPKNRAQGHGRSQGQRHGGEWKTLTVRRAHGRRLMFDEWCREPGESQSQSGGHGKEGWGRDGGGMDWNGTETSGWSAALTVENRGLVLWVIVRAGRWKFAVLHTASTAQCSYCILKALRDAVTAFSKYCKFAVCSTCNVEYFAACSIYSARFRR